jgi:hypothetical protein
MQCKTIPQSFIWAARKARLPPRNRKKQDKNWRLICGGEALVVMTSGYARPEEQRGALRIGARDRILQPATIERLGRTLDQVYLQA